ncbi:MAG: CDP-diacylglycerol--glycerol-3-phosphate 3-phosphatidyltransferase [Ruminococcaceae bacterium]|nr:CDP-diacylglycerol--glycerol-3-phosphate 3-phosphatidyltransferase [Oscillospiraceae bacterium]
MNLPNKLTVLRIILTPVFMFLMLASFEWHYLLALIVFAVAAFTDMLDGKIARKYNLVTSFGKFLDPLADKMLTTAAFLGFIAHGIGWQITWVVFIVLFREFLISSLRLIVVSSAGNRVIAANIWGKLKTVTQIAAIVLGIAFEQVKEWFILSAGVNLALDIIFNVVLWASTVLCIISGIIYLLENKEFVNTTK